MKAIKLSVSSAVHNICDKCKHNEKVLAVFECENGDTFKDESIKTYCAKAQQINPYFLGCVYFEAGGERK